MKHPDENLPVPLYVKTDDAMPLPTDESCYYVVTRDGLFIGRNTKFFSSVVPAPAFPGWLGEQRSFCRVRYPILSQRQYELIVGFFWRIAELHQSEACVLLAWDERRYHLIVPRQVATVRRSSYDGKRSAIGVEYYLDNALPNNWTVIGDVHSHVDGSAYASGVDTDDERHRAGLHIVVGCISRDPPDVHVEAVVDGCRFRMDPSRVIEGYRRRRTNVPQRWLDQVKVELVKPVTLYQQPFRYGGNGDYHRRDDSWSPK
jgi:proteasome lid subunit RPN8/RPN11